MAGFVVTELSAEYATGCVIPALIVASLSLWAAYKKCHWLVPAAFFLGFVTCGSWHWIRFVQSLPTVH
jgi:hypothetical protein